LLNACQKEKVLEQNFVIRGINERNFSSIWCIKHKNRTSGSAFFDDNVPIAEVIKKILIFSDFLLHVPGARRPDILICGAGDMQLYPKNEKPHGI